MSDFDSLNAKLDENIGTSLGANLSVSWEDFKRQAGPYILFCFVYFAITLVLNFIPFSGFIVGPFLALSVLAFVHQERLGASQGFNDFFKPFQKFGPIILTTLLILGIFLVLLIPIFFFGFWGFLKNFHFDPRDVSQGYLPEFPAGFVLAILCSLPFLIYASIITSFSTMFAYFYNVQPVEALKLGFKMGNKHLLHIVLLYLLTIALLMAGGLLCGIGLIISFPLVQIVKYHSFANILSLEHKTDVTDFDYKGDESPV